MSSQPHRHILLITPGYIGDAVFSTGLLSHLGQTIAGAKILVACHPLMGELFANAPKVSDVHLMYREKYQLHWMKLFALSVRQKWDMVIDLRHSYLGFFLRTKHRYRWRNECKEPPIMSLGSLLGLADPPPPCVWIDKATQDEVNKLLLLKNKNHRALIGVAPTARQAYKMWDIQHYIELLSRLTSPSGILPNAHIIMYGAKNEAEWVCPFFEAFPSKQVIDFMGAPLLKTAAAMKHCLFHIGNDSGLTHLAAATGTKTISLFGPTDETLYAPWGAHCMSVRGSLSYEELIKQPTFDYKANRSHMGDLKPDDVYDKLVKFLSQ